MHKKTSIMIILLIFISTIFSGCLDSREIDDEVYAVSLGIDKGVKNLVRVTIQYPNYGNEGGGNKGNTGGISEGSSQGGANIDSIDAPSILEAINMLGMTISRRISLMHTKMVVISEELAREGMGKYASPIARFRETRGSMWMVVSKQRAEEFINSNQVNIGNNITKTTELLFEESRYSNYFPLVQFGQFNKSLISTYRQPYAIYGAVNDFKNFIEVKSVKTPEKHIGEGILPGELPRKGVGKIELAGMAVFDGDKMVGKLDNYESSYFLILLGQFPAGKWTFEDKKAPNKIIVADLRNGRVPKVNVRFEKGIPVIDMKVAVEADIESIQSRIHYEHINRVQELNKLIKEALVEGTNKLINRTQKEFKSDVIGFGRWVAASFPTIQEWEAYNWLSKYPTAKINISYDVNVRRFGSMLESEQIRYSNLSKSGEKTR